jgi:hypothetical protein
LVALELNVGASDQPRRQPTNKNGKGKTLPFLLVVKNRSERKPYSPRKLTS